MAWTCPEPWCAHACDPAAPTPDAATVERVARAMVAQIDRVHADPRYETVWMISQIHIGPYTGPQYKAELDALRAALAALAPPGCPWEQPLETVCPVHGAALTECPAPR